MTQDDITVGQKLRLIVNLPDHPAGGVGIVTEIAKDRPLSGGWRFWLCWPLPGRNSYSLAFDATDLRHFELIHESMTEAACASVNYRLAEAAKPLRRRRKAIVEQLSLPLSED